MQTFINLSLPSIDASDSVRGYLIISLMCAAYMYAVTNITDIDQRHKQNR